MSEAEKATAQRELEAAWGELLALVAELGEREIEEPGVTGKWSVKDLLGHMAFWANKAAADLAKVTAGNPDQVETPGGETGTDEWNAREAAARQRSSLPEVRAEWERSFEAAKEALRATPAENLDINVKGWDMFTRFAEDTYRHYSEHAEQIRSWKREVETTEE